MAATNGAVSAHLDTSTHLENTRVLTEPVVNSMNGILTVASETLKYTGLNVSNWGMLQTPGVLAQHVFQQATSQGWQVSKRAK